MSTLNDSISNFEEEEEDSIFINSDKTNSNIHTYKKFSSNFSNDDKFFYSINDSNKNSNYFNFMDMIFTYYEQGINEYCAIVNNNLEIFNKIKEKYQNEIWGNDEYRREMLIQAEGITVVAELMGKAQGFSINRITETESWLEKFEASWRARNKESELGAVSGIFRYVEKKVSDT